MTNLKRGEDMDENKRNDMIECAKLLGRKVRQSQKDIFESVFGKSEATDKAFDEMMRHSQIEIQFGFKGKAL